MRTGSITSSKPSRVAAPPRRAGRTSRRTTPMLHTHSRREFRARCVARATSSRSYADATWPSRNRRCARSAASILCSSRPATTSIFRGVSPNCHRKSARRSSDAPGAVVIHERRADSARLSSPATRLWRRRRPSLQKVSFANSPQQRRSLRRRGFVAIGNAWRPSRLSRRIRTRTVPDRCTRAPISRGSRSCRRPSNGCCSSVFLVMAG